MPEGYRWPQNIDSIWTGADVAAMRKNEQPYGLIKNGALVVSGGTLAWVGPADELPLEILQQADRVHTLHSGVITPGLVDCHTHLVYGGNRAKEFELRLQGVSYEEIQRRGGGIASTVRATRTASEQELFQSGSKRLQALLQEGLTTVEIKSGYGLDLETELKMLRVAGRLGQSLPVTVCPTYLGAHALPREYTASDAYIDFVCATVLPEVARLGLATAVDAFCESIAFNREQTSRVFSRAAELGLRVKLHAEQLSNQNGASLAAEYRALSVDHLEYLTDQGIAAMARAKTVAVLLPGAFYCLRESQMPPVAELRSARIPLALSTDSNPGTSPVVSLLLMLNMACTLFRLTPEEALAGITREGARALGLQDRIGTLETGKQADFVLWDIEHPAELAYALGHKPCRRVVRKGCPVL